VTAPGGDGLPAPASAGSATASAADRGLLSLNRVARTFAGSPPIEALREATFSVADGEVVGIVGRSGSGKSTLMNVIGLLDRLTGGTYEIGGRPAAGLSEREQTRLRSTFFGFVFQQPFLLATLTVQENVELALRPRRLSKRDRSALAAEALERVGLAHRRFAFPATLSGGEAQRVAIARAIAQQPRVLLCDEPTGNLDEHTTEEIVQLLVSAAGTSAAVIMVTHDLVIARTLPRVLTVRDGIVSDGLDEQHLAGRAARPNDMHSARDRQP
jgi:putative ABC transport system ATP-binding protein